MNKNIEVEDGEIAIKNSYGDIAIIPRKYKREIEDMIKDKCWECIDNFVDTLPIESDYAEFGAIITKKQEDKNMDNTQTDKINYKSISRLKIDNHVEQRDNTNVNILPTREQLSVKNVELEEENEKKQHYKSNYENYEKENNEAQKKKNSTEPKDFSNIDINQLRNLSKEDIKKLQTHLVKKGYLKQNKLNIDINNKDEVSKVQQILKSRGYDLGNYGQNKDGVDGKYGKKTKTALDAYNNKLEIDGIVGNKTKEAFRKYKLANTENYSSQFKQDILNNDEKTIQNNLHKKGYFKAKDEDFNYDTDNIMLRNQSNKFKINKNDKADTKHCAFYIGSELENSIKVKGREDIGGYGDAWTLYDNLKSKGAETIYNAFNGKKPITSNPEKYLNDITNKKIDIDKKSLKSGDIVFMYYGGSGAINKAYATGGDVWSTHVGILKEDDNGNLFVEHNVGGKIKKEPIEIMLNNQGKNAAGKPLRISAISRPNYNIKQAEVYEPTQTKINFDNVSNVNTSFGKKEAAEFSQVLINNKNVILNDIPITNSEFSSLLKAVRVLGWKESNYKSNPKTKFKDFASDIRESLGIRESSKGYTQLKDEENIHEFLRNNLNINNDTLKDNKKAAIATAYALSTKYLKIKESLEDNDMTTDEIMQLALISWNEPIDMVIKTANKYKTLDAITKAYRDSYGYDDNGKTKFPYDLALTAYNNYIM